MQDFLQKYIPQKAAMLGFIAYCVSSLLEKTLRLRIACDAEYSVHQAYLFAFWHGKQLLPVLRLRQHCGKRAALVSPSRDGKILAHWLKHLGYEIIRGSSRDQNIHALTSMIRKLRAGYSVGFGVDGPIGPIYRVKPGMAYLAQKLQLPIIPLGTAFAQKWILHKAWDQYEIPMPGSKAAFYVGKPLHIAKDADLTDSNQRLEEAIHYAESRAHDLLLI